MLAFLLRYWKMPSLPSHRQVVGENLRRCRKQAGLTQEKLAERADLHPTYVSDVERGSENISLDALVRIGKALKVSVSALIDGL